jgi:hypothetical protein
MDFTPGLSSQFKDLVAVCNAVVYGSPIGLNGVACHLGTDDSTLSKMLNEQRDKANKRQLPANWITGICQVTGDFRPIQYQLEKFYEDKAAQRERALDRIPALMKDLEEALKQVRK